MGMVFIAIALEERDVGNLPEIQQRLLASIKTPADDSLYLDKLWDGSNYLMTGRHFDMVTPLGQSILGGTEVGDDMRLITPQAVKVIAAALSDLSSHELVDRYDAAAMDAAGV